MRRDKNTTKIIIPGYENSSYSSVLHRKKGVRTISKIVEIKSTTREVKNETNAEYMRG